MLRAFFLLTKLPFTSGFYLVWDLNLDKKLDILSKQGSKLEITVFSFSKGLSIYFSGHKTFKRKTVFVTKAEYKKKGSFMSEYSYEN